MASYQHLGLALLAFGAVVSATSFFVLQSVPLTALGLGAIMVGIASAMLPPTSVPSSLVKEMLQNSATNIEAILEEFNVKGRALYLPPRDGRVTAFISIEDKPVLEVASSGEVPLRVLSMAGGSRGVTVFPPGSELPKSQDSYRETTYEDLLRSVLVDASELADSVKITSQGDIEVVEIKSAKVVPRLPKFDACLGSLPSSVAASALAYKTNSRVSIEGEERYGDSRIILTLRRYPGSVAE